ncbi:thiamine/thiamine pyrophosphate ABC transporter permease ThiP [Rhodobaculum claviforme]|uniref:Thiamine/thiamine pyrophosphate ABC transporter permease ThiP n=1 Tax=Rhodobaculum claviforme TaxID=1549854 RepID=A0A934TIV7_9RHOB|nr:thiamine/thiamine pyrophosphate ABC transporter permease ThiP [Rhodobaculum claviforme]MBK5925818.1 thiamine/thiamine pyrophosphate ABC transporter permease ThiP [Rhodobaculum claviforme]
MRWRAEGGAALWLGAAVALGLLALNAGTLAAVLWRAEAPGRLAAADWAAVRFTLGQALVSAGLSVALAVPVARALARRRFVGRGLLITALGAPFLLPTLVAVLGLLAVFGRGGVLNAGLGHLGLGPVGIYGPHGVVLAHVFFNLPLATRLILQGWLAIPAERFRLAAALGFMPRDIARHLERPMLREVVPGAFVVIFLICLTSFAVALTLGGGPRATTVELAIYQAFRLEFDLARAGLLAVIQFALCAAAAGLAWGVARPSEFGAGLDRPVMRLDVGGWRLRAVDGLAITLAAVFLLVPLGMVVARGLPHLAGLPAPVWAATARSLGVALASTALCMGAALALGLAVVRAGPRLSGALEGVGLTALAASPLVIGTGLFIVLFPLVRPGDLALPVTALVNAAMALPFALRALIPALRDIEATQGRLAESLGLRGAARLRLVTWPRLRRPMGFGAGLAAALSMGDLGVIVLFADPGAATLPLQVYRLMGAYRMDDAAGAALLLLMCSLALFWLFDRGGRLGRG